MTTTMEEFGLGRIQAVDQNDQRYLLRTLIDPREVRAAPAYRIWPFPHPQPLDQGNTGTCVGHGAKHHTMTAPGRISEPTSTPTAFELYRAACRDDPWPENDDGNLQFGTSVRAGMRALQSRNLISNYYWTWGLMDAVAYLLTKGTLVLGLDWTESMFYPDRKGTIKVEGDTVGGHCLLAIGVTPKSRRIRLLNSWGPDWGQNGRCWISYNDFELLLDRGGEAVAGVEQWVTQP